MTPILTNIPSDLQALRQWIVWRYVIDPNKPKPTKPPFQAQHPTVLADPTKPLTWGTFSEACQTLSQTKTLEGPGFVFAPTDSYCGLDLDGCIDAAGTIAPWAQRLVDLYNTYTEVSPSGSGLHLLSEATLSGTGHKYGSLEVYDRARYFTVTGHILPGSPPDMRKCQQEVDWLYACIKPFADTLARYGNRFGLLFAGDWQAATDANGVPFPSQSEADLCLCSMAVQCGATADQIDAIVRLSGLYRPKWDQKHGADTYGAQTIALALKPSATLHAGSTSAAPGGAGGIAWGSQGASPASPPTKESHVKTLLRLAQTAHLIFTPEALAYARVPVDSHYEVVSIGERGSQMRYWLGHRFKQDTGGLPSTTAMAQVMEALFAQARFEGERAEVATRFATMGDTLYVDLASDSWEAIEIDAHGWRIVAQPPIYFRRPAGLLPLPMPDQAGTLADLNPLLPQVNEAQKLLIKAWLLSTLQPYGALPILCIHGEQGSAKSTVTRLLRSIVDPNQAPARSTPKEIRDLVIAASNARIVGLENLSYLPDWLSDALCCLSTGSGYGIRKNYSDNEETLFSAKRPVILNGIAEVAVRGDLVDRCVFIDLPEIPDAKKKQEADISQAFATAHAAILGGLLRAASIALRRAGTLHFPALPRMADFTVWAEGAVPELGAQTGIFLQTYQDNRQHAVASLIDQDIVAEAIKGYLAIGKANNVTWGWFHNELTDYVTSGRTKRPPKGWPSIPRVLSSHVKRLAPALRKMGYLIIDHGHTKNGTTITIEYVQPKP